MKSMDRPLQGVRVLVTRAADRAGPLTSAFRAAGAQAVELPLLEVASVEAPLERYLAALEPGAWIAFTSVHAVERVLPALARYPAALPRFAVVGPATAAALRGFGVAPHLVASPPSGASLGRALAGRLAPRARVLVPQAADARPELVETLRAGGVIVDAVVVYEKRLPSESAGRAEEVLAGPDALWISLTSPRVARTFIELVGTDWPRVRERFPAVAIGPTTAKEGRRLGFSTVAVAKQPTPAAMVNALVTALP